MKFTLFLALSVAAFVTSDAGAAPASDSPDVLATLRPGHPRLLAKTDDWNVLRACSEKEDTLRGLLLKIERDGRELLLKPPLSYEKEGRRLLAVSRAALNRITIWAFCRRVTGEAVFAERAEKEMLPLAAFADWNPSHFLDVAEMTAALAIGYDWLYADLSPTSRATIRQAIVEKGLRQGIGPEAKFTSWRRTENNWNQVCFGGLTLGALAVAEDEPALARAVLEAARRDIVHGLKPYAPDGVYPEGPGYWNYGTTYQVLMLGALESALGTTWQLENSPGFGASAAAQLQQTGPTGLAYNFADGGENVELRPALFWFARRFEKPDLLAPGMRRLSESVTRRDGGGGRDGFLPFVALWWNSPSRPDAAPSLPLAWLGDGPNPIGVFRSSWTDTNALYLAFKGGSARLNHAHMDAGSFVFEADGVRWACDLGAQSYHSIESKGWNLWDREQNSQRWKVYRLNNYSHSTLTIDGQLHRVNGDARITTFDAEHRRATVNLTEIFEGQATDVVRHFQVGENREVAITDDLRGLKPGVEVCWQLVTRAAVELARDQATLRQNGKVLRAHVTSPAEARFEVHPADPPADGVNAPNPGANILALKFRAPADGRLPITVSLRPGPDSEVQRQALERLPYNHPGLVVDLGVGLWAWPVPCDADGDGDFDLIVSCPDQPHNGVYLFENAEGDTARNKMPVFKPARRLSSTVPYVMPSYVNGQLRVLTPGAEYPNFARTGLTKKVPLSVKADFYKPKGTQPKGPKLRHNQWRYADYDGDGQLDLVVGIEDWSFYGWDNAWDAQGRWTNGPLHGFVHVFRGTGEGNFAAPFLVEAAGKPVDTFGCPTPNFADFDADGDLDLLCGEFLDGFTYFENIGTRPAPRYAAGRRIKDARGAEVRMELQMIVPIAFDWDKDGDLDFIVGDEDGRVAFVENTGRLAADRTPVFAQPVYFRQAADTLKCGALATPVGVDWDGDGDQDLVSGNTAGFLEWFENLSGPGVTEPKWAAPRRLEVEGRPFRIMAGRNGSIQGPAEAKWGYTTFSVADWDNDGRLDIVLNSILGEVVGLKNIGTRAAPKLAAPEPIEVEWNGPPPALAWGWRKPAGKALLTQWRTTPVVFDFNGDGLPDLAMLDPEGYLALFERTKSGDQLTLKAPRRAFVDEIGSPLRLNSNSAGRSGRRKICVTDWDGDGRFDLLLNSANANLLRQVEARDGRWFFRDQGALSSQNIEGHDVSPAAVDFNNDGIPDFLGGAEDGRFYYLANPRTRFR